MMMVHTSTISLVDHCCHTHCGTTVGYLELKELEKAEPHIPHKHMYGSNHPGSSYHHMHKNHLFRKFLLHRPFTSHPDILTTYVTHTPHSVQSTMVAITQDVPTTTGTGINCSGSSSPTFVTQSNKHNTQLKLMKPTTLMCNLINNTS